MTCSIGPKDFEKNWKGYVEINLKRQHPTEPYFDGELWFVYADETQKGRSSVSLTRSAGRGYGESQRVIETAWNETFNGLIPKVGVPVQFELITVSRLHQYFPFDSGSFDFTLAMGPGLSRQLLRVSNHVPGFILPCSYLKVSPEKDGSLHVQFVLLRSPLIQLFVMVLCVALIVFLVLIVRLKEIEALATAVASYFFSAFSLRTIVSDQMKTVPTLFDLFILSVCMFMLVALLWTVSRRKITHPPERRRAT